MNEVENLKACSNLSDVNKDLGYAVVRIISSLAVNVKYRLKASPLGCYLNAIAEKEVFVLKNNQTVQSVAFN